MNNTFPIRQASKLMGVTVKTLQRWDRDGKLVASRTPTGRRVYTVEQLRSVTRLSSPRIARKPVAYLRVSSQAQRTDLKNQRKVAEEFCVARGLANVDFVEEIGGGLNFKRKQFLSLVDRIIVGEVSQLVLAHKDRLVRFGFDLLQHLCDRHDCELLIINSEQLSPKQEMVQELMTIVHCFSSRLYGLRNYKKSLREALK
jgi:predicted site-specific integrase-resolvase